MTFISGIEQCIMEGDLYALLSCCVYKADSFKLDSTVKRYKDNSNLKMLGCSMDGRLAGCAGVDVTDPRKAVLLHLAVDLSCRGRGIGRKMIGELMKRFSIRQLEAETDDDAVGFYRNCGFQIENLGEKYPGFTRYRCTFRPPVTG